MTLVNVALDDVGAGSRHTGFAGYLAFSNDWMEFTSDWLVALTKANIESLHTKDFLYAARSARVAAGLAPADADLALLEPFVACVHRHELFGLSVVVETAAYDALSAHDRRLCGRQEELAFDIFVRTVADLHADIAPSATVTLAVDEGNPSDSRFLALYKRFKKLTPRFARRVTSLTFADDAAYPAIQAADLLSHCFHRFLRDGQSKAYNLLTRPQLPPSDRQYGEVVIRGELLGEIVERRRADAYYVPKL